MILFQKHIGVKNFYKYRGLLKLDILAEKRIFFISGIRSVIEIGQYLRFGSNQPKRKTLWIRISNIKSFLKLVSKVKSTCKRLL